MASVQRSMTVEQPIETVWAYLSDFRSSQEWDPPSIRTERVSGDGGVGTRYHNVSKLLGSEQEVNYVVTEYEENARLQLAGDAGSVQLLDTITLESTGSGTTVTYHAEFTPRGKARLAEPLLPIGLKLLADRVEKSLMEHLRAL